MKKVLLLIVLLLVITLSSCLNNKKTIREWALYYVVEAYNQDYEDYGILGHTLTEIEITADNEENDYHYYAYQINIVDESGRSRAYNIVIVSTYNKSPINIFTTMTEKAIIDVDIEEAYYD